MEKAKRARTAETPKQPSLRLRSSAPELYSTGWGRVGSGRQGRSPAGESPVVSVARVGHVAMPQFMVSNPMSIAWCKRPGCPVLGTAVGATGGSSELGSLNISE